MPVTKQMTSVDLMRARFEEAKSEVEEIEKRAAPLRKKLDAGAAEFERARLAWAATKNDLLPQIRQIEQPRLTELRQEISRLAVALGAKRMSRSQG